METADREKVGKPGPGEISSDGVIKIAPVTDQEASNESATRAPAKSGARDTIRRRHQSPANRTSKQDPPVENRFARGIR